MKCYARYLPYALRKPLFGDRRRFGTVPVEADTDWREWQARYMDFYTSTQKGGIGKRINDAGYVVLSRITLDNKVVCEVGPGALPHLAYWQGRPREYIAVDISEAFLEKTAEIFAAAGHGRFRPVVMSRASHLLPIADASVDVVLSFYSLEHFTPLNGYLAEFRRILKPGGLMVGAVPNEGGLAWGLGRYLTSRRWIHRHTTIDYDKIICWEHPNFTDEIFTALAAQFNRQYRRMFPLPWLPAADLNLVTKFIYQKPEIL
jgi:SAM-dependent methyltransferase